MANPLSERKLSEFLSEVANWRWDDFVRAEKDEANYSTADAIVFALIRACAMEKMEAIKLSINRLDGKLPTPVKVVYPKAYYLFPYAKSVELEAPKSPESASTPQLEAEVISDSPDTAELTISDNSIKGEPVDNELPTLTFRQTLSRMVDYPRDVPKKIVQAAIATHRMIDGTGPVIEDRYIPLVKSVVAAHLIQMAKRRDIDALYEVFDSIDGKLTETLQVVGEDIYLTSYSTTAPFGAELNKDGVYQIEARETERRWVEKLGGKS